MSFKSQSDNHLDSWFKSSCMFDWFILSWVNLRSLQSPANSIKGFVKLVAHSLMYILNNVGSSLFLITLKKKEKFTY